MSIKWLILWVILGLWLHRAFAQDPQDALTRLRERPYVAGSAAQIQGRSAEAQSILSEAWKQRPCMSSYDLILQFECFGIAYNSHALVRQAGQGQDLMTALIDRFVRDNPPEPTLSDSAGPPAINPDFEKWCQARRIDVPTGMRYTATPVLILSSPHPTDMALLP